MGSMGDEIAEVLSKRLHLELVTRERVLAEWLPDTVGAFERNQLSDSPRFYMSEVSPGVTYKEYIEQKLKSFAGEHPCIVVGMGAQFIFEKAPEVFRIRFVASDNVRLSRIVAQYGIAEADAQNLLTKVDKSYRRFISTVYQTDNIIPTQYDIVINTDDWELEHCVRIVQALVSEPNEAPKNGARITETAAFKHPAEVEFAKILDMYQIDWMYEPRTFPVEWDNEGNVKLAFRPDFYLPKFDTYIEITTMSQKHVTTKNKKVRRLKELYPDIHIHIVYKKDFHSLLKRFGREEEGV
jgi:cytidylate kinase